MALGGPDMRAYKVCGELAEIPRAIRVKLEVGSPPASFVQVGVAAPALVDL